MGNRFSVVEALVYLPLALFLYVASDGFVHYWPLGLLQAALAMLIPVVVCRQVCSRFGRSLLAILLVFSLLVGVGLVSFEGQGIATRGGLIYLLAHGLCLLLVFWEGRGDIDRQVHYLSAFRQVALLVLVLLCLVNTGPVLRDHVYIALLECFLALFACFVFRPFERRWLLLLAWLVVVGGVVSWSNLMAMRDSVGLADWWRALEVCAHFLAAFAFYAWFRRDEQAVYWVCSALMTAVFIYFTVLVYTWLNLPEPVTYNWVLDPPLFGHIRHVGYFLCMGVVSAAWSVLVLQGRLRCLSWVVYVLAVSMLLWSGSRGAFLAAFVGCLGLLLMSPLRIFAGIWRWLLVGLLLSLLLSALFVVDHPGLGWLSAFVRTGEADSLNGLSSSRLMIWAFLLDVIVLRPGFGWGGEAFRAIWVNKQIIQAHNGLLQLMLEWGVVGTLVIGSPLCAQFLIGAKRYWQSASGSQEQRRLAFGFSLVLALLLLSLVDGVLYYGTPSAFLGLGLALLVGSAWGLGSGNPSAGYLGSESNNPHPGGNPSGSESI